jgi:hypothetical protein
MISGGDIVLLEKAEVILRVEIVVCEMMLVIIRGEIVVCWSWQR